MAQFSALVNVAGLAAYPPSPQVTVPFTPKAILIVDEHATEPVFVSFDGKEDHGRLTPGVLPAVEWHQRSPFVWLRPSSAGTASPVNVRIMVEDYG